eukprot:850507-Rhodomonas_salina.1
MMIRDKLSFENDSSHTTQAQTSHSSSSNAIVLQILNRQRTLQDELQDDVNDVAKVLTSMRDQ